MLYQTLKKPGKISPNGGLHFCLADHPVFSSEEPSLAPGDITGSIPATPADQPTKIPCPLLPTTSHHVCPRAAGVQLMSGDIVIRSSWDKSYTRNGPPALPMLFRFRDTLDVP